MIVNWFVLKRFFAGAYIAFERFDWSTYNVMENSSAHTPRILTAFNYIDWRVDMQMALRNKGLFRMTMGREDEPQQYVEKSKFLNRLDEAFDFMCIHISRDILFHLEGLITTKEAWDKIQSLFGKQYDLRGHILENELIALQPISFKNI